MFALSSLTWRFFRPFTCTGTAHSLWSLRRLAYSTSQDNEVDPGYLFALRKQDPSAYAKWRYHNDPEFRERMKLARRKYLRRPEIRKRKLHISRTPESVQYMREYDRSLDERKLHMRRRSQRLFRILSENRWIREGWTWKLHTPVITPDRVDHHCTACQKDCFLRVWWATKAEPTTYICNSCFASHFDLMVPEGQHKRLPQIFTSPDYPSPSSAKP
ncbi:hypothetical protein KCU81_g7161, partial [Aureobasidium melanogenum]|uniref:Uncharacterized protein n=1 Tax=Aureobasidium melanogenum (strain CBS 110374) TaxID=1043003 RepID=A0A074W7V7_AURM1